MIDTVIASVRFLEYCDVLTYLVKFSVGLYCTSNQCKIFFLKSFLTVSEKALWVKKKKKSVLCAVCRITEGSRIL